MNEAFPASIVRERTRLAAAPLDVWVRALLLFLAFATVVFGYLVVVNTPLSSPNDTAHFRRELNRLQDGAAALRASSERPLTLVFIGTSRMKNVASDAAQVARAAREAGIDRPVVSSLLAVHWGGFQRFQEVTEQLVAVRPDYVVVMPMLLYEDFTIGARTKIALRYLQGWLWRQDFDLFEDSKEFEEPTCGGFEDSPEWRQIQHLSWMQADPDGHGPRNAAALLRRLAANGTKVYIVDVPVHEALARIADRVSHDALLRKHRLDGLANLRLGMENVAVPADAYCDYAHIEPNRASLWLRALFEMIRHDG